MATIEFVIEAIKDLGIDKIICDKFNIKREAFLSLIDSFKKSEYSFKEGSCDIYYIPPHITNFNIEDEEQPEYEKKLEEALNKALFYLKKMKGIVLNYGDLVKFDYSGYRNDGVVIYDGKKLILLDYEEDDYGHLPPQFRVLEVNPSGKRYPVYYWHSNNGIDHNTIVWFDHRPYIDELIKNINYDSEQYNIYTSCLLDNKITVYIVLDFELKESNIDEAKQLFKKALDTKDLLAFHTSDFKNVNQNKNILLLPYPQE